MSYPLLSRIQRNEQSVTVKSNIVNIGHLIVYLFVDLELLVNATSDSVTMTASFLLIPLGVCA